MKAFKQLFALLLAAAMLLALGSTALAAGETYSITIENTETGHVYEAYQVFKGELSLTPDGRKTLSNVEWGNGLTAEGQQKLMAEFTQENGQPFEDELDMSASLTTEEQIKKLAKISAGYLQNPHESGAQQDGAKYVIADLEPGFYLVKDKNSSLDANINDFYTAYIMRIVGDATAAPKGEKPTLDKEIKRNNDDSWGKVGDSQIGDTVEFRIITSVPDTTGFKDYADVYDYIVHDTMSTGLTSNVRETADVTVKINDGDALDQTYYNVTVDGDNANKFSVKVNVLGAVEAGVLKKGDKLYFYYSAMLNEKAMSSENGREDNTAFLEYSNNPADADSKGNTPTIPVYEWTYELTVDKVNVNSEPLTGAKFVLSKDGSLKAADFKCTEDGTPTENLDKLIPVLSEGSAYTINPSADGDKAYVMEGGTFSLKGLDDVTTYYLYETKSPVGYNLLKAPVAFQFTAHYSENGSQALEPTLTVDDGEASTTLSTKVVNKAGTVLPETGGIGTTIFYIVGALLVVGAVAALVFLRRRSEKSER